MTYYATLADARNALKANTTTDDAVLQSYIRTVTARLHRLMGERFEPYWESRSFVMDVQRINSYERTYRVDGYLLALSGLTVNSDVLTLTTDFTAWPPSTTPFNEIQLADTSAGWYSVSDSDNWPFTLAVSGAWGIHQDYARAWQAVDTLAALINATQATLTVTDADGVGYEGETPRFSPGNLIAIDSEWLRVTAVNTTTNTLTVRRGENGTTAAAHGGASTVSSFYWEPDVRGVVARQAALMYSRRGAFEQVNVLQEGVYTYPPDLLPELRSVMQQYIFG